ncbi:membrane lipoprotein lipid attachment site-containing protein [Acinetobacter guillouiae]|uniref:membrane lipoprotein lipid attachment site-containing protein n=1 Tax=Acinetobacter guillouiae TaxID=106649 RepID=UPI001250471D|nr:membrane lipoprotein lipid attachment site-containing protein [Acinetobacter guillouiae]
MKKIIMLLGLSLILASCKETIFETEKEQQVEQNLNDAEINMIWERLDHRIYRCEKPCPRQDLTEISFSKARSHYIIFTPDVTGFIEAFYKTQDGMKININWDDGTGGFKNEDLDLMLLDEYQLKIRDKHHNINQYQFLTFDDE